MALKGAAAGVLGRLAGSGEEADNATTAAAAAAAVAPDRLDAVQAGPCTWLVLAASGCEAHIWCADASGGGGSNSSTMGAGEGSPALILAFPEEVALVQLGVPSAAPAGNSSSVLVVVGARCTAWAFALQQAPLEACGRGSAASAAVVGVAASSGAVVPVAQGCLGPGARPQLAAQVVWEHLCCCWEQVQSSMMDPDSCPMDVDEACCAVPLSLPLLLRSLAAVRQEQPPPLVNSVATWVCRPEAAAALPPDAVAVSFVSAAAVLGQPPPPLLSSALHSLQPAAAAAALAAPAPAAASQEWLAGQAIGHLIVASASGDVVALPVGTPYSAGSAVAAAAAAAGAAAPVLPLVVCVAGSRLCLLDAVDTPSGAFSSSMPSSSARGGPSNHRSSGVSGRTQHFTLCTESGRVVCSPPLSASSSSSSSATGEEAGMVVITPGRGGRSSTAAGSSSSSGCSSRRPGGGSAPAAVVRLVGDIDSLAASGALLVFTSRGRLCAADMRSALSAAGQNGEQQQCQEQAGQPVRIQTSTPVLVVAAVTASRVLLGSRRQALAVLTAGGALLQLPSPVEDLLQEQRGWRPSLHELEGLMEVSWGPSLARTGGGCQKKVNWQQC